MDEDRFEAAVPPGRSGDLLHTRNVGAAPNNHPHSAGGVMVRIWCVMDVGRAHILRHLITSDRVERCDRRTRWHLPNVNELLVEHFGNFHRWRAQDHLVFVQYGTSPGTIDHRPSGATRYLLDRLLRHFGIHSISRNLHPRRRGVDSARCHHSSWSAADPPNHSPPGASEAFLVPQEAQWDALN